MALDVDSRATKLHLQLRLCKKTAKSAMKTSCVSEYVNYKVKAPYILTFICLCLR